MATAALPVAPSANDAHFYALLAADHSPVGLVVLDGEGTVRHVNHTLACLLSASPSLLTGNLLADSAPDLYSRLTPLIETVRKRGRPGREAGMTLPLPLDEAEPIRKNGAHSPASFWDVCCAPVPTDPAVAASSSGTAAPHMLAVWLWPEDGGTVASRQTVEALRDSLNTALPPSIPGFEIAAALVPSEPGAVLGGDTYDVVPLDQGRWALLLADVAGRGPVAAARAVMVRHSARVLIASHKPGEALSQLGCLLLADASFAGFVTAFLGVIDTRANTLTYAIAGHDPALLLRGETRTVERLGGEGDLPLGVDDQARYADHVCSFTPADLLLLYTDGLSDTRRNEEFFDEQRVCDALVRNRHLPAAALVATLLAEVGTFAGLNTLRDDTALLAVRGQDAG